MTDLMKMHLFSDVMTVIVTDLMKMHPFIDVMTVDVR